MKLAGIDKRVLGLALVTAADLLISPTQNVLLLQSLSAGIRSIWAHRQLRKYGRKQNGDGAYRLAVVAGLLLALAQISRKATWDSDTISWGITLIPGCVALLVGLAPNLSGNYDEGRMPLLSLIIPPLIAFWIFDVISMSLSSVALGLSFTVSSSYAITLLSSAIKLPPILSEKYALDHMTNTADASRKLLSISKTTNAVFGLLCVLAALNYEGFSDLSATLQSSAMEACTTIVANCIHFWLLMELIQQHDTSIATSANSVGALIAFSGQGPITLKTFASLLSMISLLSGHIHHRRPSVFRFLQLGIGVAAGTLIIATLLVHSLEKFQNVVLSLDMSLQNSIQISGAGNAYIDLASSNHHPVKILTANASSAWHQILDSQSTSLKNAAHEYRQRYGMHPPPLFDKWFDFAKSHEVAMIDEYDTILENLTPFRALEPRVLRDRVREALGNDDNGLISIAIRDGKVNTILGGLPWQRNALLGLVSNFVGMLPDMDIAVNAHDEPRIVVPHDELSEMVKSAKGRISRSLSATSNPQQTYSPRLLDVSSEGSRFPEVKTSRFNEYTRQNTWVPTRLSCSPHSPSRNFTELASDASETFALTELGFVSNLTASTDVCQIPSLKTTHGFFDRPNSLKVAHELIPIFSESKVSTFQDILFPSMWHWNRALHINRTSDMHLPGRSKPMYDARLDMPWTAKNDTMWWRGSTTGGYSRNGGWRRQHRQQFVSRINSHSSVQVLEKTDAAVRNWKVARVQREDFSDLFDVQFSGIGQCDPGDCRAQEEFFDLQPYAPLERAWGYKHLLDLDGNAFSARFYALLQSSSLVYKMAVFREWHQEWVQPWVHYVPLSIKGDEHLEAVRYLAQDEEGKKIASRLAERSQDWASKALRRIDMEAWMFRLLLEYARLVDDNRELLGYAG